LLEIAMIRYLLGGLLFGLILTYAALSMLTYRPGTALPMALFFGPWLGFLKLSEVYTRQYGYWAFLSAPILYLIYAFLLKWNEKRGRISVTTLLIFVFHYCGVIFTAQVVNVGIGEPRRFLLVMKNHAWIMALGFAVFVTVNVLAILRAWIAKE
jgi:hypothetical protein